jgi:hypothetical protein
MLTETSTKIINITETVLHGIFHNPVTKFRPNTSKMFSMLFNRIAYANELWKQNNGSIRCTHNASLELDTSYYPDEIKDMVNKNIQSYEQINFQIGERNIILYIGNTTKLGKRDIDCIVKRVYIWLTVASFFSNKKCSQSLTIYLSMSQHNKLLPTTEMDYIDREHVNTAFTYPCKKDNEIHIFRKEEWFKVLIHESFHSFGLDFSEYNDAATSRQILKIFNVTADVRVFESYCEIWAELLNDMFVVFYSTRWNENQDKWMQTCIRKFEVLVHNEQKFSVFQCAKILSYYQLQYKDILHANSKPGQNADKYRDRTHVLSYYIIKTMLLYNVNDFIEECVRINGYSINFNKDKIRVNENMQAYCKLIEIVHDNAAFIIELTNMTTFVSRSAFKQLPKQIQHTLRMSAYELK